MAAAVSDIEIRDLPADQPAIREHLPRRVGVAGNEIPAHVNQHRLARMIPGELLMAVKARPHLVIGDHHVDLVLIGLEHRGCVAAKHHLPRVARVRPMRLRAGLLGDLRGGRSRLSQVGATR